MFTLPDWFPLMAVAVTVGSAIVIDQVRTIAKRYAAMCVAGI